MQEEYFVSTPCNGCTCFFTEKFYTMHVTIFFVVSRTLSLLCNKKHIIFFWQDKTIITNNISSYFSGLIILQSIKHDNKKNSLIMNKSLRKKRQRFSFRQHAENGERSDSRALWARHASGHAGASTATAQLHGSLLSFLKTGQEAQWWVAYRSRTFILHSKYRKKKVNYSTVNFLFPNDLLFLYW